MIEIWLSRASSIASLLSLGLAIWAYIQARKAFRFALQVRDELRSRRKQDEASQIHTETRRIFNIVSKVGPACTEPRLKGIDCASIAKDVQEYCSTINEHSAGFTEPFKDIVKELCKELYTYIEALAEAKKFKDKKSAGVKIFIKIDGFLPVAKAHADKIRERIVVE